MATQQGLDLKVTQTATWNAFKGKLSDKDIQGFIDATTGATDPSTLTADASIYFGVIFGVVKCTPSSQTYKFKFEEDAWGLGGSAASGSGIIYLSGADWNYFFQNTAGYEAQGISSGGGVLQITFFNSSGVPIGQYNGVCGGVGSFACGGKGSWQPA